MRSENKVSVKIKVSMVNGDTASDGEVLLIIAAKTLPQHCRTFFTSLASVAVKQHVQAVDCDRIALHLVHLLVESLHHTQVGLGQVVNQKAVQGSKCAPTALS